MDLFEVALEKNVVLVFALEEEYKIFCENLKKFTPFEIISITEENGITLLKTKYSKCATVNFNCVCTGFQGVLDTSDILNKISRNLPQNGKDYVFVNIGICGRVYDENHLGDVLIVEQIYDITNGTKDFDNGVQKFSARVFSMDKIIKEYFKMPLIDYINNKIQSFKHEEFRRKMLEIDPKIRNAIEELKLTKKDDFFGCKAFMGAIVTGPGVGESDEKCQNLLNLDRKMAALDCETAAIFKFAKEADEKNYYGLAFRGISDPVCNRKKEIEKGTFEIFRKIAVINATIAFSCWVENIFLDHKIILKGRSINEISCPYGDIPLSKDKKLQYINLFSCAYKIFFNGNEEINNVIDLEKRILTLEEGRNRKTIIYGQKKEGKTTFLSLLFHVISEEDTSIPVYFKSFSPSECMKFFSIVDKNKINADNIVILLDELYNDSEYIFSILSGIFPDKKIHLIMTSSQERNYDANCVNISLKNDMYKCIIERSSDNEKLKERLEELTEYANSEEKIKNLMILWMGIMTDFQRSNFSTLLCNYIKSVTGESDIKSFSKRIFDLWEIQSKLEYDSNNEVFIELENEKINNFVNNVEIRNFLIAFYICNLLGDDTILPDMAFPNFINKYVKILINESSILENKILSTAKNIALVDKLNENNCPYSCLTYYAYLLGRTKKNHLKNCAIEILKNWLHLAVSMENKQCIVKKPGHELLLRTIYISLAALGDNDFADKYIHKLLVDSNSNEINRGFHLQYYGDQALNLKNGYINEDERGNMSKTYAGLRSSILFNLNKNTIDKTLGVKLFTMVSLICVRYLVLPQNKIPAWLDLIKKDFLDEIALRVMDSKIVLNKHLYAYLTWTIGILHAEKFHIYDVIYYLNMVGFVKNDERNVDTRTLRCIQLAVFLLPDSCETKGYNKENIINMLLIHEWWKCELGGRISPNIKSDEEIDFFFYSLRRFGKFFKGKCFIIKMCEIWAEYKRDSFNSKIAKDIILLDDMWKIYNKCKINGLNVNINELIDVISKMESTLVRGIAENSTSEYFCQI